jgi:Fe-S-cluster containining protein
MSSRCSGDCCKAFVLGNGQVNIKVLKDNIEHIKSGKKGQDKNGYGHIQDVKVLASMLVSLGKFTKHPLTGAKYSIPKELFTCKHLQDNGDCGIYESRPNMCRDYPHGKPCEYPGCTWSADDQLIHNTVEDTMRVSKYFLKFKPEKDLGIEIVPGVRKRRRQEIEELKETTCLQ